MQKYIKKLRINITMPPDLLARIDAVAGMFRRSWFIHEACEEKLQRDKKGE